MILFAHNEQHKRLTSFSRSSLTPELFLTQHLNGDYSADEINDFVSLLKSMNLGGLYSCFDLDVHTFLRL